MGFPWSCRQQPDSEKSPVACHAITPIFCTGSRCRSYGIKNIVKVFNLRRIITAVLAGGPW